MISCVMPTTSSRWWTIPLAVECWRNQTYENSELIIVADGPLADLWDPDPRISLLFTPEKLPLGEKYNFCIQHAAYPWVALWADDDWHAPTRLERTAAAIAAGGVGVVADYRCLFHELGGERRTSLYTYPWHGTRKDGEPNARYVVSGTMAFERKLALETPFPAVAKGSDDFFVHEMLKKTEIGLLEQPPFFYVAMCHKQNTSSFIPTLEGFPPNFKSEFEDVEDDISTVMGGEAIARYEAAYANFVHRL